VHSNLVGLHVDVAFLGTLAISVDAGLTTADTSDAVIKSKCLALAERNILLAESVKFGAVSMCRYGEISDLDVIVSDAAMSDIQASEIMALGVDVILA
jgi:DeoR family fructose operon transcriptional repressor